MSAENGKIPLFSKNDTETVKQAAEAAALFHLLQKNGGTDFHAALDALKMGNYEKAAKILKPLLNTPDAENLIERLNQKIGRA